MLVKLGNKSPREWVTDDTKTGAGHYKPFAPPNGKETVTSAVLPDDWGLAEAFQTVTLANGIWDRHSGDKPTWVSSDDDSLATLLASHFGCKVKPWGSK